MAESNSVNKEMILPEFLTNATFFYFAFGSNLLAKRIHIQNPTAIRKGYGYIENFKLDFFHYSTRWGGSAATIVPSDESKVWGAIWEIDMKNVGDLDNQEGVHLNIYKPLTLSVIKPNGDKIDCRVYQLVNNPPKLLDNQQVPYDRQPSKTYIDTIIKGAKETGLPEDYLTFLRGIPHNGNTAEPHILLALDK